MLDICCLSYTESEILIQKTTLGSLRTMKTMPGFWGGCYSILSIFYVSEALRMRKRKLKVEGVLDAKFFS